MGWVMRNIIYSKEYLKELKKQLINCKQVSYDDDLLDCNINEVNKKENIKKLINEGKFFDIYARYGKLSYLVNLPKMMSIDIKTETGKNKQKYLLDKLYKLMYNDKVRNMYAPSLLFGFISYLIACYYIPVVAMYGDIDKKIHNNYNEYSYLINEYENHIKEYAKSFNTENLSDLEIIIQVMIDMWEYIGGYGNPDFELYGIYGLALLEPNSYGVCRNIADDYAARLNAINPEYNARYLTVSMDTSIKSKLLFKTEYLPKENDDNCETDEIYSLFMGVVHSWYDDTDTLTGNHAIVLVDIKKDNITLAVDPTNPSIGIYQNGKIYMFSTENGKGYEVADYQLYKGSKYELNYIKTFLESYFKNNKMDDIIDKWGIEAETEVVLNLTKNRYEK